MLNQGFETSSFEILPKFTSSEDYHKLCFETNLFNIIPKCQFLLPIIQFIQHVSKMYGNELTKIHDSKYQKLNYARLVIQKIIFMRGRAVGSSQGS